MRQECSGAATTRPVELLRLNQSGGTMRAAVSIKTILFGIAVVVVSFFVSLKAMDWLSPRGSVRAPVLVELPPLPTAARCFQHRCAGRDCACRHSRRRRPRRAAQLRGQGRQSGVAAAAGRRHRLDRVARTDRGERRPGRAVAGDAADGKSECDRFAVVEGDGRGRRRDRRPPGRQPRQADRQREHQVAQCQRGDQG